MEAHNEAHSQLTTYRVSCGVDKHDLIDSLSSRGSKINFIVSQKRGSFIHPAKRSSSVLE